MTHKRTTRPVDIHDKSHFRCFRHSEARNPAVAFPFNGAAYCWAQYTIFQRN